MECLFATQEAFLSPRSYVLPEKLMISQLVKKLPAFYGNRKFITVHTTSRHLSSPNWIQSTLSQHTHETSILILSSHLCLGLPRGLFPVCICLLSNTGHMSHPAHCCSVRPRTRSKGTSDWVLYSSVLSYCSLVTATSTVRIPKVLLISHFKILVEFTLNISV